MEDIKEENLENINETNVDFQDPVSDYDLESELYSEDVNPFFEKEKPLPDLEFEDDSFDDIDFSELSGDFKKGLKKINKNIAKKKVKRTLAKKPKKGPKGKKVNVPVDKKATIFGGKSPASRVIVPRDRKVIVEGIDKFILSQDPCDNAYKQIGYHCGKKLAALVFTFNNNSALDFTLELFNPSTPMDYFFVTNQNINNKISVAGDGVTQYTDVLYNLLANPAMIYNARLVVAGDVAGQQAEALVFKNKNISGEQRISPLNVALNVDNMQVQSSVVNFDIVGTLNRPFIPDGMDVVEYTVLAGNTVTLAFFYEQKSLKKLLYAQAAKSRILF